MILSLTRLLFRADYRQPSFRQPERPSYRPHLEQLEDRNNPSVASFRSLASLQPPVAVLASDSHDPSIEPSATAPATQETVVPPIDATVIDAVFVGEGNGSRFAWE